MSTGEGTVTADAARGRGRARPAGRLPFRAGRVAACMAAAAGNCGARARRAATGTPARMATGPLPPGCAAAG